MTVLLPLILEALNRRKNKALTLAEACMPANQYRAFRRMFLDDFGQNGLERELAEILAKADSPNGMEPGRPMHAKKGGAR